MTMADERVPTNLDMFKTVAKSLEHQCAAIKELTEAMKIMNKRIDELEKRSR